MPYPVGDVCLGRLVNENDWAHRLGHNYEVLSWPGFVGGSSWAQAHGTHSPQR